LHASSLGATLAALTPSPSASDAPAGFGEPASAASGERLRALLLLLPAAVLCWPSDAAPLARDPFPHLQGAGLLALTSWPLALVAWRRVRASLGLALLVGVVVAGALSALFVGATDTVELRRAAVHGATALALFAAGSSLGAAGRAVLARGLVVLSIACLLGAFTLGDLRLAGVLGNTGALSQAALPGALCGLVLAARGGPGVRAAWRVAGVLAFAGFAAHAGRAPVLASLLAAAGALVLAAALARRADGPSGRSLAGGAGGLTPRFALLAGALALPLAFALLRAAPAASEGALTTTVAGDTGGAGVRLGVWDRVPALLGDHALFGVGPGQMQAAFPPYRDPAEIVASAHGSCDDHATEIDHLHNDALHELGELGLVGGLLWLAFLGLAAWRAFLALRSGELARAALGTAAIALLANALAHSVFVFHPASAAMGFALLGALSVRERDGAAAIRAVPPSLALLPVIAAAVFGWPLIRHGRALTAAVQGRAAAFHASEIGALPAAWDAAIDWRRYRDALDALPSSVEALRAAAEWERFKADLGRAVRDVAPDALAPTEAGGGDWADLAVADPRPWLLALLERRPHDQRALQDLASAALKQGGDVAAARARWEDVLALDPAHPRVLRNLVNLELDFGDERRALGHLDALRAAGCEDAAWVEGAAERMLFEGRGATALALLARSDSRFKIHTGEAVIALSKQAEVEGRAELAYGLESHAHHLFAEDHAAHASWSNAVRSLRQAIRPTASRHPGGAALLRLELCAAQHEAGDADGAAKTGIGLSLAMPAARHLPSWARAALEGEL